MTDGESDLNRLREIILNAQKGDQPYPDDPSQRITVGPEGQIYSGDAPTGVPLSKLHHGTFAIDPAERLRRDTAFAKQHMPANAVYFDRPDVRGWCYSITTQLCETYVLLAYFDGIDYKVKLVEPALERLVDGHRGHIYADATICLSDAPGAGQPTLEEAYAKSVLWALGMGFVRNGHPFPFTSTSS